MANDDLLRLNHEIRLVENALNVARRRRRWSNLSLVFGPISALIMYALYWSPWLSMRTRLVIAGPLAPTVFAFFLASVWLKMNPGYPAPRQPGGFSDLAKALSGEGAKRGYRSEAELEIALARLREQRKDLLANAETPPRIRKIMYKEEAFAEIDRLRSESNKYRRVNNGLQGILIIGSLAATGASGLATQVPAIRWMVMGIAFIVGISSGFMGYFKYKERSFYLQQTADAVEQEWEAFEVGVGRYKHYSESQEDLALADFVEEIHRLRSEQRKRQQNLEQPAEARSSGD